MGRTEASASGSFLGAYLQRQLSGDEFGGLAASDRPIGDVRGFELTAPKRPFVDVPKRAKVAQQVWAHTGGQHALRLKRSAQRGLVRAHHLGSLVCKPLVGITSTCRMASQSTASATARNSSRCTARDSSTPRTLSAAPDLRANRPGTKPGQTHRQARRQPTRLGVKPVQRLNERRKLLRSWKPSSAATASLLRPCNSSRYKATWVRTWSSSAW